MLVGPVGFVGLAVPPPWQVTKASVTPEVHTTVRESGRQWVASGETRHVVFDPGRRLRIDLVVRVMPRAPRRTLPPLADQTAAGAIVVAGHPGEFLLGRRRDGWLSPRLVPTLRVRHRCDRTGRTILIELSGAAVEDLRALLAAVGGLECHGPSAGSADRAGEPV